MEVNSRARFSIISNAAFKRLWPAKAQIIRKFYTKFRDFQKNVFQITGICDINVKLDVKESELSLVITKEATASLIRRNWFQALAITVNANNITTNTERNGFTELVENFKEKDAGCSVPTNNVMTPSEGLLDKGRVVIPDNSMGS